MSSEMRELIAKWRAVAEKQRGMASRDNERGDLECAARMAGMAERTEYMADELEALLTRTEAGADVEWNAHSERLYELNAAPVADGAVPLWISCHWREDLARDSVVSVVNRQDPAHTLQVYVSTHPHDASAVTEAMVERAMNASMPGGSTAWVWLFNCEGGMRPEDKHLDWFRRVLTAALPSPPKEREE